MSLFDSLFPAKTNQTVTSEKDQSSEKSSDKQAQNLVNSNINPILKHDINALSHLDARATQIITQAYEEAKKLRAAFIEPDQLLLALISDREIFNTLQEFSVDVANLTRELQAKQQPGNFSADPTLSETSKQILESAYSSAKGRGVDFVTPEDMLLALFSASSTASEALKAKGLDKSKVEEKFSKNTEFQSGKKSALKQFGIDLTEAAAQGKLDPVAGRDIEMRRMVHILLRRTKNNPVIIGEAGTGKTAIVEGLAQMIIQKRVPSELQNRKIIQLEVSSLVAGASHRGEFEERLQQVIKETMASNGQIILFIDEIHTIIGAGETGGALDASNILKPYLARGQIQVIGATTTAEYRRYLEKDKAFQRRFQPVVAEEPNEQLAIEMLKILQPKYEKFHRVTFAPESLIAAVKLSKRYIGERFLPDKAIDLLDESASEIRLQQANGKRQDSTIKEADIQNIVSAQTGIPIAKLTEKESDKLLHLEELIHKKYIDHDRAVKAVAEAVRRGRIGLANLNRPIASFIFLGPTGTGKTEIAKILAEIMFGAQTSMIRLDMSEYMEKHEVAKLIGAPPGYVGYEEGGQLTEAVRKKPYSIVLLDEIEKAHPDVFNIMLQLLEDGRLTDNKGNTVSFKNTIVIATSNVGSNLIRDFIIQSQAAKNAKSTTAEDKKVEAAKEQTPGYYMGVAAADKPNPSNEVQAKKDDGIPAQFMASPTDSTEDDNNFRKLSKLVLDELNKHFRPEFLNRFDEIVIFEPLTQQHMTQIAKLGIENTRKMLKEQQVGLQISQTALNQLAKEGYDPVYGARPLRRLIQRVIENPIAIYLINKSIVASDTVIVDYNPTQDKFTFNKQSFSTNRMHNPVAVHASAQPAKPAENQSNTPSSMMTASTNPQTPTQPNFGGQQPSLASSSAPADPESGGIQPLGDPTVMINNSTVSSTD
ncbi:ATP-dependent Clp protease ATP-binding subunit [Candidatus Daviesbacteria bacterium]|nr:ATP-dependent Clp protease ATP-binding subunit [Candidatus Daviesbacteria bacterium]